LETRIWTQKSHILLSQEWQDYFPFRSSAFHDHLTRLNADFFAKNTLFTGNFHFAVLPYLR
jgi:hypothetical protein